MGIIKKLVLISVVLISPMIIKGQKDYLSGYVITNSNDTLHGLIKDRSPEPFVTIYKKIRFRDNSIFHRKFGPDQIQGYKMDVNLYESIWIDVSRRFFREYYFSIPGRGEKQFLKVISRGYLTYYHLEYIDSESSNIDYIPLYKRQNEQSLVRATQGIFGLKKKRLAEYFQDCPDIVIKIENMELSDPLEVVNYYNLYKATECQY